MNAVIQSPAEASKASTSRSNSVYARHATTSPPRTPPRRRKDPPSSYPKSARLAAVTSHSALVGEHGHDRDSNTDDDVEDHHDLTYTSRHIPRASLVDNMVMALDQFSIASDPTRQQEEDSRMFRGRGHTFSSSISSESDIRPLHPKSMHIQPKRLMRRSSARYAKDPARLPSVFGEDEDAARVRVYEAQRAPLSAKPKKSRRANDKQGAGSASSLDLSHLQYLQGRLGPAGNRRSQSFDFGSRKQSDKDQHANDTAPHPVIYSGPKAQNTPTSPALRPAAIVERDGPKTAKADRQKLNTLGTNAVHGTTAPPVPSRNTVTSTPSGSRSPNPETDHLTTSKSGFFRRVFGSSRNNLAPTPSPTLAPTPTGKSSIEHHSDLTPSSTTPVTKLYKQTTRDVESNKENVHPVITKKPSSFFRRRKKSVGTAVEPPLPLTLAPTITNADLQPGRRSPVSSLKAFMDPYLTGEKSGARSQTPTSPLHTFYTATADSAGTGLSRAESPEPYVSRKIDTSRLLVPQKETFLTDSSSAEDVDHSPINELEDAHKSESSSQKATPRASSAAAFTTTKLAVEPRSSPWPDRLGIPPRSDSLPILDTKRITSPLPKKIILPTQHRNTSGSDVSEYKSAPSTPALQNVASPIYTTSPSLHVSHPSFGQGPTIQELDKAQDIYNNGEDDVDGRSAAAWLGEIGNERERIRKAYMQLFDWSGSTILAALRSLCSRLVLKAESQLIDRILDAFAKRWCDCNLSHGFKTSDVVHTICYSVLLLNTDLYMAEHGSKMTRSQFVKNSMPTIRAVVDSSEPALLAVRSNSYGASGSDRVSSDRDSSRAASALSHRLTDHIARTDVEGESIHGLLVDVPFSGSSAAWELQIEAVLKDFYFSIQREPLPLFGSENAPRYPPSAGNNNLLSLSGLRRTPSVLSKQSESNRSHAKSLGAKWNSKARSRPRLGSTPGFGSSKNSLEDQSTSAWSPSMSSTWSKASLGKTLTSMSVDSFATKSGGLGNEYQSSIGFANALSQAIIREDQLEMQTEDGTSKATSALEDESLELEGAPWAKEGILKHKCHLEGVDKRSKDRNWNDCFAVMEKGWMRLFSFSVTAKSLRRKAQNSTGAVGGGNWQDSAQEVWKFMLRHTIASSLPPPGYSKARPHVWALSLPTGAVHLFSVGTPDIVQEFVSTANFWSARLSKEPMIGGVSSMEYGWSDAVINRAFTGVDVRPSISSSDMARPSTQMSVRSSIDQGGSMRPRLPGDKLHISEWTPPQQSLLASQLMEVDQLKALQMYVQTVEEDLQKHNELRGPMMLAFSTKHGNYARAMSNWEKKSNYLLREIVKFRGYSENLIAAETMKQRVYKKRRDLEEQHFEAAASMAIYHGSSMGMTD